MMREGTSVADLETHFYRFYSYRGQQREIWLVVWWTHRDSILIWPDGVGVGSIQTEGQGEIKDQQSKQRWQEGGQKEGDDDKHI